MGSCDGDASSTIETADPRGDSTVGGSGGNDCLIASDAYGTSSDSSTSAALGLAACETPLPLSLPLGLSSRSAESWATGESEPSEAGASGEASPGEAASGEAASGGAASGDGPGTSCPPCGAGDAGGEG